MVWFGLVWFGLVWSGLVWFGLVWFGILVWFGLSISLVRLYLLYLSDISNFPPILALFDSNIEFVYLK